MLMLGLARLGNEPEVRYTPDGKALMDLSLALLIESFILG